MSYNFDSTSPGEGPQSASAPVSDTSATSNGQPDTPTPPALRTALAWLDGGYWPVPITPIDDPGPKPGKRPLGGKDWGKERPTPEGLRSLFEQSPDAGVGLVLGCEGGVIDLDVDDPEAAALPLARLFPDGLPETRGWGSNDDRYHLLFEYDERLARYGKRVIKGRIDPKTGKVVGNPHYLGLELRIGTTDPAEPSQTQSVIPPSRKEDGTPRRWNGHKRILPLPESVFADLDRHANPPKAKTTAPEARPAAPVAPAAPKAAPSPERNGEPPKPPRTGKAKTYDRNEVLEAITGDESGFLALLGELGVSLTGVLSGDWMECFAVDRDEAKPSAGVNAATGVYHDFGSEESVSLFDLAARLRPGDYPDWRAAVNRLGERFIGARTAPTPPPPTHQEDQEEDPDDCGLGRPNEAPDDPHRLARHYRDRTAHEGVPTLRFWRGDWHRWDGSAYKPVPDSELKGKLSRAIKEEFDRLNVAELGACLGESKNGPPKCRPVTVNLVANVNAALASYSLLDSTIEQPAWLDGDPPFPLAETLVCRNALVHLPSFAAGKPAVHPPTPLLFTPCSLAFDFDPSAPEPVEWLRFLASVWPGDQESVETLRQWFGYVLTPDTSQQKILFLNGPSRCGKGTIGRILRHLVGALNAAGPTLASITTNFGLAPLVGKSLAVVGDVRLSGKADQAPIIERLLSISGEDNLTLDRKMREAWSGILPTRLVLLANEPPRITDASNALVNRLLVLSMTESFLGREDLALEAKLLAELPGILLWAIEGWRSLRERGRFIVPAASRELVAEMAEMASPVGAFLAEVCEVGDSFRIETKELFDHWRSWCAAQGRDFPGDSPGFGRNLRSVLPKLRTTQTRRDNQPVRFYEGVRVRQPEPFVP